MLLAAMKAVINERIIESSWKHEGVIPFTRAPEKKLRAEEEMKEQRLGKASNTLSAPTVMVGTDSGPVPIVVPKVTKRAREDPAKAFDSIQKTDIFAENIEALKDKLLKKLQNKEKVLEEEINELGALGMKVAKERDDLMNATEQFIKDGAPIPRASDMWSIAGGVNSTEGLARMGLGSANAASRNKLAVDKKKEKEEKKAAKAEKETKDFEEELKQADEVKLAFLKRIQNQGMDAWKRVSYFDLKNLYVAKERKQPKKKIHQKDLITMMKEAYKDDYIIGSLDE